MIWGMSFDEIMRMTWTEYEKKWLAWQYQRTFDLDILRRLETTIFNYGGMGVKDAIDPSKWLKLGLIDTEDVILPIRNKKEALEIFRGIIS